MEEARKTHIKWKLCLGQGMAIQFAASEMATIQIDLEAVQTSAQAREAVALAE